MTGTFVAFTRADWLAIAPEVVLAAAGCAILLLEAFAPALRRWFATLSLAGVAASLYFLLNGPSGTTFGGRFESSPLTTLVGLFLGGSAALAILVAKPYLERTGEERANSTRCCCGATWACR